MADLANTEPAPMYNNIMVDLETLGRRPGCVILSIGAVAFDPDAPGDGLGQTFYAVVSRASCHHYGLTEDFETVQWWEQQNDEAKRVLKIADSSISLRLTELAHRFHTYRHEVGKDARIWGNGADFDNAILMAAYDACGMTDKIWPFWRNRCYRTLKGLAPVLRLDRTGLVHHNALDDAVAQARHAVEILRNMKLEPRLGSPAQSDPA